MGAPKRRWGKPPNTVIYIDDPDTYLALYRGPNWAMISARVRARDRTCRHTGRGECHGPLQANHKVEYRRFANHWQANKLSNLELLCRRHHELVDADVGSIDWHPDATWYRLSKQGKALMHARAAPKPAARIARPSVPWSAAESEILKALMPIEPEADAPMSLLDAIHALVSLGALAGYIAYLMGAFA